jgi:hypothetical protein
VISRNSGHGDSRSSARANTWSSGSAVSWAGPIGTHPAALSWAQSGSHSGQFASVRPCPRTAPPSTTNPPRTRANATAQTSKACVGASPPWVQIPPPPPVTSGNAGSSLRARTGVSFGGLICWSQLVVRRRSPACAQRQHRWRQDASGTWLNGDELCNGAFGLFQLDSPFRFGSLRTRWCELQLTHGRGREICDVRPVATKTQGPQGRRTGTNPNRSTQRRKPRRRQTSRTRHIRASHRLRPWIPGLLPAEGDRLILLLCGGDKNSQPADIKTAQQIAQDWRTQQGQSP